MKAEREEKEAFVPVTLTLETQTEVDGLYTLLNHAMLSDAVGLCDAGQCLLPYRSENFCAHYLHLKLNALLK